jgi:hypothetical protein
LWQDTPAPRQFSLKFSFKAGASARVSEGNFSCSYVQNSSGGVAIQEWELSTDTRRFRALRREKGAYSVMVDDDSAARKGRHLAPGAPCRCPRAIAMLGQDGPLLEFEPVYPPRVKASFTWGHCACKPGAIMSGTIETGEVGAMVTARSMCFWRAP